MAVLKDFSINEILGIGYAASGVTALCILYLKEEKQSILSEDDYYVLKKTRKFLEAVGRGYSLSKAVTKAVIAEFPDFTYSYAAYQCFRHILRDLAESEVISKIQDFVSVIVKVEEQRSIPKRKLEAAYAFFSALGGLTLAEIYIRFEEKGEGD